jgi:hypothetical protein
MTYLVLWFTLSEFSNFVGACIRCGYIGVVNGEAAHQANAEHRQAT